jgi:hypothetical protein
MFQRFSPELIAKVARGELPNAREWIELIKIQTEAMTGRKTT